MKKSRKLLTWISLWILVMSNVVMPWAWAQESAGEKTATLLPWAEFAWVLAQGVGSFGTFLYGGTDTSNCTEDWAILSTNESEYPVCFQYVWGWYVKYYTEADKIYLNEDSSHMFDYAIIKNRLSEIDTTKWDTSNVRNMESMFNWQRNLQSIDLTNWDTSNVTNMNYMFTMCNSLTELDLSDWDTHNVTGMRQMFAYCSSLSKIYVWDKFKTDNVVVVKDFIADSPLGEYDIMFIWDSNLVWQNWTKVSTFSEGIEYARIDKWACQPWYFSTKNPLPDDVCEAKTLRKLDWEPQP